MKKGKNNLALEQMLTKMYCAQDELIYSYELHSFN